MNSHDADSFDTIIENEPKPSATNTPRTRKLSYFNYFMLFLLVIIGCASNWIYEYRSVSASVSVKPSWMISPEIGSFSMGGWPLKYYVQSSGQGTTAFSFLRLIGNIGLWTLFGSCYYLYLRYQRRKVQQSKSRWTVRLLDVFVYTTVVAVIIFYAQVLLRRSKQHREYGQKIASQGGKHAIASFLPTPLRPLAGWGLASASERMVAVQLVHPTAEQIQQALQIPYLQGLYLQGGDYDLRLLDEIPNLPLLKFVGVGGRKLDQQFVATLSRAKHLKSISLPRTNITREGLEALGEMPNLEELGLLHTNVQCDFETIPPWAKSLVRIQLPRPPAGQKFVHKLHGWPKLEFIECLGGAEARNTEPLPLELTNLPSLEKVLLDVLQSFDLTLKDIPNVIELAGDESEPQRIQKKSDYLPKSPMVKSIKLSNIAPSQTLTLDVSEIEKATIENCHGIDLILTVSDEAKIEKRSANPMIVQNGNLIVERYTGYHQKQLDKLIKSLENSQGLASLSIFHCNTSNVNWSVLSQSNQLKQLTISKYGIDARRIDEIRSIKSIQQLTLDDVRLPHKQLNELLSSLPELTTLAFNHDSLKQLSIENHEHIETVFYIGVPPAFAIQSVKLVNLPKFRDYVVLSPDARSVVIDNVPDLPGIFFHGPCPKDMKFSGLQNLKYFVGGGAELKDEQVQEILKCKTIETLALCHCQLSDETLSMIASLPNLTALCLTGTKVPEHIADQLSNASFPKLRRLWVNDTGVNGDRWEKLILQPGSETEAIYVDRPTQALLEKLPSFFKIRGIGLRHTTLQAANMGWTDVPYIDLEINLDGSILDEQAMFELAKRHPSARRVSMRGSKVPGNGLLKFIANSRFASFDIEDINTDAGVVEQLHATQDHRIMEQGDYYWQFATNLSNLQSNLIMPARYSPRAKESLLPMLSDDGQRINEPQDQPATLFQAIIDVWDEITFWNRYEQ